MATSAYQAPQSYVSRRPLRARVAGNAREVYRYRHLVHYLVSSSLRTENVNSIFGFFWWLLDPLLLAATYMLLVQAILHRGTTNYPVYIMVALMSWEFFQRTVRNAMAQTLGKERSMRQVAFPKSVIPLSAALGEGVHFVFALIVLVLFAIPFGITPSPYALLALPIGVLQLLFTLGVAYAFAALNMFFRDTSHLSTYLFRVWFYLSPGIYQSNLIPESYRHYYELNPFAILFTAYRKALMYHELPHLLPLVGVGVASIVVLLLGYAYFVSVSPKFAKVE
jgi:ABC-type polysaccharide/polyol phosphate export permease